LIIFISCQNEQKLNSLKTSEIYFVRSSNSFNKGYSTENTITFRDFYFDYNIILIDSISSIYYHIKPLNCMSGTKPNNEFPNFCNLKPENFLTVKSISDLMKIILTNSEIPERIYLISNNDTIRDIRYFKLKDQLSNHDIKTSTRVLTEEEEEIMKSILKNTDYRPENINWVRTLNVPSEFNSEIEIIEEN